jgi:CheY-like chemotaxis protein
MGAEADRVGKDYGRVLVVEDDDDIRESIVSVLEEEGYAVEQAAHGADALEVLRRDGIQLPCVIVLDLMMPVMNGWDFRARLLEDVRLASIPVVCLSGDARVAEKAAKLECAAAISKPVSLIDLLALVARFCPDTAANSQL